ncbi:MAG: cupin domain-containing protein, partial [Pseudomonadota bacterium]
MIGAVSGDLGAKEVVRLLDMTPHPEGGWYVETFRAPEKANERAASTAIYYLLEADQVSAWHRVDADEIWLWHAGGPLALTVSPPNGVGAQAHQLGPDLRFRQRPQVVVSAR